MLSTSSQMSADFSQVKIKSPFVNAKVAEIQLQDLAVELFNQAPKLFANGKSPLLDSQFCQKMIEQFHSQKQLNWSYTPFAENRSVAWYGSYLNQTQSWVHVGVDVNLRAGTGVKTTANIEILRIDNDQDLDGGWGPRIFAKPQNSKNQILIFAHLGSIYCKVGEQIAKNQIFAEVGSPPNNGNWYEHLHIQLISEEIYLNAMRADPEKLSLIDGYLPYSKSDWLNKTYFDPVQYMALDYGISK